MSWSLDENQRFEQAMAAIEGDTPEFWQLVAQAVGAGRTADDAWQHYLELHGDIHGMGATDRTFRRRRQYRRNAVQQQQQQHGADAGTAANNNNSRRNDRRRSNGGEGSSSNSNNNSRGNNNRTNRPQA